MWGLGLAYSVEITGGAIGVYHTDGLGSVRAVSESAGNVVQTYQTDEFGVATLTQGTSTQPFQYTGEQRDAESGFMYLRARAYDSATGRFLQRDRVALGMGPWMAALTKSPSELNRYAYGLSNPIRFTDPAGLNAADQDRRFQGFDSGQIVSDVLPVDFVVRGFILAGAVHAVFDTVRNRTFWGHGFALNVPPFGAFLVGVNLFSDRQATTDEIWDFIRGGIQLGIGAVRSLNTGRLAASGGCFCAITVATVRDVPWWEW